METGRRLSVPGLLNADPLFTIWREKAQLTTDNRRPSGGFLFVEKSDEIAAERAWIHPPER